MKARAWAFLAWDYSTKHGRLPALGVNSYAAAVLSTLLLTLLTACALS